MCGGGGGEGGAGGWLVLGAASWWLRVLVVDIRSSQAKAGSHRKS